MKIRKLLNASALTLALTLLPNSALFAQSNQEAADKAYQMAAKYSAMGYYVTPSKEGRAGFATTLEFTMPVNMGLDYIFILGGDRYTQDIDIWIESEAGTTIVKDTRATGNGMAGVSWRSEYNGTVNVVVHFARVTSRTAWAALAGRRGNPMVPDRSHLPPTYHTQPGRAVPADGGDSPGETSVNE